MESYNGQNLMYITLFQFEGYVTKWENVMHKSRLILRPVSAIFACQYKQVYSSYNLNKFTHHIGVKTKSKIHNRNKNETIKRPYILKSPP